MSSVATVPTISMLMALLRISDVLGRSARMHSKQIQLKLKDFRFSFPVLYVFSYYQI